MSSDTLDRRLAWSVALNMVIVVAEIAGGWVSGSLALMSDAMHNLSDVAALAIALFARRLSRRPPSLRHTFGYRRVEVLAALVNSATLLVVVTLIVREAIMRLQAPTPILGGVMLAVAITGLAGNLISVLMLHGHAHDHDLNTRSAILHLMQDTLSSVVVVIAALLAGWKYGAYLDPIASLLVALVVVRSGWSLLMEALHILMEATPRDVDIEALQAECVDCLKIQGIHHVHVWETGGGARMLTAHIRLKEQPLSEVERQLEAVREHLATRWRIEHATLEPEFVGCGSDDLLGVHRDAPRADAHGHGHGEPPGEAKAGGSRGEGHAKDDETVADGSAKSAEPGA